MNHEELVQARAEYQRITKEEIKNLKRRKEVERLLQTKEVQRYLELKECLDYTPKSEKQILEQAFKEITTQTKNSKKIMICLGGYVCNHSTYDLDYKATFTDKVTNYRVYKDLETERYFRILIEDTLKFESDKIIIKLTLTDPFSQLAKEKYYELRTLYLKEILKKSQEEVMKNLPQIVSKVRRRN